MDDPKRRTELVRLRRKRRRLSSSCFFAAGVGFGTAIYLLRARFSTLAAPNQRVLFLALVALMVIIFWLGARAEAEVGQLDEQLRDLDERARR
jgi:hypothetical protein